MGTTLQAFKDEVAFVLGNQTKVTPFLAGWVQRAYVTISQLPGASIAELRRLEPTFVITAGLNSGLLAGDYFAMVTLRNVTDKHKMHGPISEPEWASLDTTKTGIPTHFFVNAKSVYVWPTPVANTTFQAIIRFEAERLALDADQSILPENYDQTIVELAASCGFSALGEEDRARYYLTSSMGRIAAIGTRDAAELTAVDQGIVVLGLE
jgi:hypothetical protein